MNSPAPRHPTRALQPETPASLWRSKRPDVAEAARRALQRLRSLTSERDTWLRAQPAAEHTRAVAEVSLGGGSLDRTLRNDDMVLQTCLLTQRTVIKVGPPVGGGGGGGGGAWGGRVLSAQLGWRCRLLLVLQGYCDAGYRAAVFLLTNDRGLTVRAEANGVRCLSAEGLPRDPRALAKVRAGGGEGGLATAWSVGCWRACFPC